MAAPAQIPAILLLQSTPKLRPRPWAAPRTQPTLKDSSYPLVPHWSRRTEPLRAHRSFLARADFHALLSPRPEDRFALVPAEQRPFGFSSTTPAPEPGKP